MSDDYTWPTDPRIPALLELFAQLHADVRGRVHQAASVEVRDALLQVVWRIEEVTEQARRQVGQPARRPSPRPVVAGPEPTGPRSPLDPGWEWQTHEARQ